VENSFHRARTPIITKPNKIHRVSANDFTGLMERYKMKRPILQQKETQNEYKKKLEKLFLESKIEIGSSRSTIKKYVETFKHFDSLTIEDFDQPNFIEISCALVAEKDWTKGTLHSRLAQLCAFSSFLFYNSYSKRKHRPPKFSLKPKRRDLPSSHEWELFFSALSARYESASLGRRKSRWRDYLMCRVLFESGMRISECCRLKVKDLVIYDQNNFWLFVDGTKSEDAERSCPISEKLVEEIRAYLWTFKIQNRDARMFFSKNGGSVDQTEFTRFIGGFAEKLKISAHITPHVFRHDYIFRSILSGMSPFDLIARLGHSDMKMTFYYFKQVKRLMPLADLNQDYKTLENQLRARGEFFSKKNLEKGW
jgi:integrase/recombinase XerD